MSLNESEIRLKVDRMVLNSVARTSLVRETATASTSKAAQAASRLVGLETSGKKESCKPLFGPDLRFLLHLSVVRSVLR